MYYRALPNIFVIHLRLLVHVLYTDLSLFISLLTPAIVVFGYIIN